MVNILSYALTLGKLYFLWWSTLGKLEIVNDVNL